MGHLILGAGLVVWCILTVPATIFGGVGGAVYGAFPSSPEYPAFVEEVEAFFRDTLAEYPIQETFQSSFLKEARARTSHTFVRVPVEGLQTSEGMFWQGVDSVLELNVQRIWFKRVEDREGEMNPPMVLALVVRARLVRGTEKTVWYDQTFVHETEKRPYVSWRYLYYRKLFQADIEKAYQNLAEQMVEKLFLSKPTT
jgi:hypothetical protein